MFFFIPEGQDVKCLANALGPSFGSNFLISAARFERVC
jgi:hypothetical protein